MKSLVNNYTVFKSVADGLDNWTSMSKSELLNAYISNENDPKKQEMYLAAIMCKYWYLITVYFKKTPYFISMQDCLDWLTDAVIYALDKHKWTDPNSSLYNAPKGPEKAVNCCVESSKSLHMRKFFAKKRPKELLSLDSTIEPYDTPLEFVVQDTTNSMENMESKVFTDILIERTFNADHFLESIILDGIMYGDVFINGKGNTPKLCKKWLSEHIFNLDDSYCRVLAEKYSLDFEKLKEQVKQIKKVSPRSLLRTIDTTLEKLKNYYLD